MHPIARRRVRLLPLKGLSVIIAATLVLLGCASEGPDGNMRDDAGPTLANGHTEVPEHDTGPRVRVNQLGYLPSGPKRATLVTAQEEPVSWQLRDEDGDTAAEGRSTPQGIDPSAGLNVHTLDFSGYPGSGRGYTLHADDDASHPFDVVDDLYAALRQDALNIYYTQRSGIAIDPIEVDGDLARTEYERPAGHVSEFVPPEEDITEEARGEETSAEERPADPATVNRGDLEVPCLPAERFEWNGVQQHAGVDLYGGIDGWQCPAGYALDVTGGWYDAGDQGKYMANSGSSVWQLLSTYERNQNASTAVDGALGDETLLIPERGNDVPDILDEARWNLEWMLSMQVPQGTMMILDGVEVDAGGMAHHKVHDIAWTEEETLPHEDPMPRYLHRPSTAATLNLAAVAAQGARLYAEHDSAFADELLNAAESAWWAASAHDDIFPDTDITDPDPGGGPYDDHSVSDEFYWAATQLYLTTGWGVYEDAVLSSEHHVGGWDDQVFGTPAFDWKNTAGAARLDLAAVDSELSDREEVIGSVVEAADAYLAIQEEEPFGHPYGPEEYEWGSNHMVLNNAAVIATAFDLTGQPQYRDAAIESIDYILGRNALNNSYVKGYGTSFSENMHSRWFAPDHDRLPPFPDGKLAGGANSGFGDPTVESTLDGCAPQACYIDDADSWSTNETTINWNAALAWHASWLDDMGRAESTRSDTP